MRRGFTLFEMLIVCALLLIVAGLFDSLYREHVF